jgi:hypothetical protein
MRNHTCRLLVLTLLAAGCQSDADGTTDRDGAVEQTSLVVAQTLGDGAAAPEYEFGSIWGLAVDAAGRLYVADGQSNMVRVYTADGRYVFDIGRQGAGPGELDGPCCLAVDAQQQLWVRDGGNARYDVFRTGDSAAAYVRSVRMAHGDVNRSAPLTFDEAATSSISAFAPILKRMCGLPRASTSTRPAQCCAWKRCTCRRMTARQRSRSNARSRKEP